MASKLDLHVVVAPVFATNCCILVKDDGAALVVDPGAGVFDAVVDLVTKNGWQVKGVAATHGHPDHTWDGGRLAAHFGVPFIINQADQYRLADPLGSLQGDGDVRPDLSVAVAMAHEIRSVGAAAYQAPALVQAFSADSPSSVLGELGIEPIFAPGHTEGSTLYVTAAYVLSGDVLFASGIGRTDFPGGDSATMTATLRRLATELDPWLGVIPGHGPTTTVAKELATNPYWLDALRN